MAVGVELMMGHWRHLAFWPRRGAAERIVTTGRLEDLWRFSLLFLLGGLLLAGLDAWLLQPVQINGLGLLLLTVAACSYLLEPRAPHLAAGSLVCGSLAAGILIGFWWPGAGAAALLALPVGLATLTLGRHVGLVLGLALSLLLVVRPLTLVAGFSVHEVALALLMVNLAWLSGWISESRQESALTDFLDHYERANQLLDEARDSRLLLNQANEDLTEAYRQVARLNEQLRASQIETEQARRAKEEFVANVSHELRTPLNMIIGFSEMILNAPASYQGKGANTLLADMGVIYRNSQHLLQLINDVLDLSQVEAGQLVITADWADLAQVAAEAVEAVAPLFQSKGLALALEAPPDLPAVWCDRLRIRQILLNLLSNAGRLTSVGGVTVTLRNDRKTMMVSVSDSGPGIALADQNKIFDPFQQLDASTRRLHEGSGLGLSISKRLVELHGGRMGVESTPGVGSTFFFSLPLAGEPEVGHGVGRWFNPYLPYTPRTRRPVVELTQPPAQIMVLDRAGLLHHHLASHLDGVEIVRVQTVDDLKNGLAAVTPSAILINDAQVMADWRLIRRTLRLPPRTPVISCYVPGLQEACEQLNVVDYLVKPVTRSTLLSAVARVAPPQGTLLLAEDNAEMAHLVARQLTTHESGYRLLRAGDGSRALALMRQRQPDAVLLDLGLPGQDGYQVLREKNADPIIRAIPVLIISARDPLGEPVVTNRLRVEMADGLSVRDILLSAVAVSQALSPLKRLAGRASPETPTG
jgi:signal transduction histidine kinase/CheY-like chemotaxis protein